MSDLKHNCHHCGQHIAYPPDATAAAVECPNCGQETTLGEVYPETPAVPSPTKTWRVTQMAAVAIEPPQFDPSRSTVKRPRYRVLLGVLAGLALLAGVASVLVIGMRRNSERILVAERMAKDEADKLKAEVEKAKAEAERLKLKAEELEKARAAAKAAEEAKKQAIANASVEAAAAVKLEMERKSQLEADRFAKLKANPAVLALWGETDLDAVKISAPSETGVFVRHNGKTLSVKYSEMPDWLRERALVMHREEGEAKGLIREVAGKTYDLRYNPPGWVTIPSAKVLQVLDHGYLMINEGTSDQYRASVFRLKHTGLVRVLNVNDRMQVIGISAGTYTYKTKGGETKTVPMYDPGMPVGPLREKVVLFGD